VDGSSTRHVSAMDVGAVKGSHDSEELSMQQITTIGLDIAKSVFQIATGALAECDCNHPISELTA